MASKWPLPDETALLEVLDVLTTKQHAGADSEMPGRVVRLALAEEPINGAGATIAPAIRQLPPGEDVTGCYLAGLDWIHFAIVH